MWVFSRQMDAIVYLFTSTSLNSCYLSLTLLLTKFRFPTDEKVLVRRAQVLFTNELINMKTVHYQ